MGAAVATSRETKRKLAQSQVALPKLAVGEFVLCARVCRQGVMPRLMSIWTSPRRVVVADHAHVCSVQSIVSVAVPSVHFARLRLYADSQLKITAEVEDAFPYSYARGEFHTNALVHIADDEKGNIIVSVDWIEFDAGGCTWESLRTIHSSAPKLL